MKNVDLSKIKKAHFTGIGGVGVSAIARMMLAEGKIVSGSDVSDSAIIDELRKLGAKIFIGHSADNVANDVDLLVYTPAVTADNLELKKAAKLDIPTLSYPEMLGLISKDKYTIAVSGAHGKTTTTAMIAKILIDAGLDPTVIVGSLLKDQGSNFVAGKSEYFVVEACEYKKSFLNLNPKIIVITNIDNDHLDYYGNLENIKKAFGEFAAKLPKEGYLVCDPNDENLKDIIKEAKFKIIDYTKVNNNFNLKIPGEHNIKNAQAAIVAAEILGVYSKKAENSLESFEGTWRRFEFKGETKNGVFVYDDYGHHPTEIKATLKSARELYPKNKIIAVFQPHLYSRTKRHLAEFGKSFKDADLVAVSPIYAAREKNDSSINSEMLAEEIKKNNQTAICFNNFSEIEKYIIANTDKNNVVITIGAGDVYKISDSLIVSKL
ncbi:MAG: UDP-N-acetylmuramate-L-alanine ligase [Parcubacteria group bacterium GW2011_GWA1_40_21]|nr:MAG: UDP-N-acetylmuramate-L-alanine ligase [Parcubacteria group bacterium GW2011_GWC1_40_13]KKR54176.1 MAG: UDP-N-acetylmuramate-L-alanine ligase [Parcubacteria group bacterium GW2011_GWA1_40_21]